MQLAAASVAWARQCSQDLPRRWRGQVLARWQTQAARGAGWIEQQEAERDANVELRELCASLGTASRVLPLDATDAQVCEAAERIAADMFNLATAPHLRDLAALRAAMAARCRSRGVEPPKAEGEKGRPGRAYADGPAVARMTCAHWWRRQLRRLHARAVEGAAIRLGLVNRTRDPYCSDESLRRRLEQNARNVAALESTVARNELGQEYTLAELAAKGPANKAIRRAELMTRIAGFERIALELGHAGLFLTITCPSRMHRWRTVAHGHKVIDNPRYDGTNPREANEYLGTVWARVRAALHRRGIRLYGFRIAEPQHDGTPHWHFLVFHRPEDAAGLERTIRKYALADSPNEPGAQDHRCDFKPIDRERGTAAGYIAKYVAKNIDGYRLEKDLIGNDALETSARVEAWAATWRIRQFQQVGGPPVGVWRELRRVEVIPEGAPAHLIAAHRAVNKLAVIEGRENASVAWDHYCKAQGGVLCGRRAAIQLAKVAQEGLTRYGDEKGERVIGVQTTVLELWSPPWMAHIRGTAERLVQWVVESTRHAWEIVGRKVGEGIEKFRPRAWPGLDVFAQRPKAVAPWTRVNNCTEGGANDAHGSESARDAGEAGGSASGLRQLQSDDPGRDGARSGPHAGAAANAGAARG